MIRGLASLSSRLPRPPRAVFGVAALFALAACGDAVTGGDAIARPPPDVTEAVERIGNPFTVPTSYGRNVWDMQLFGGLIRLGHGDSIENLGPIPIWSIDPETGALVDEFTTSEEQVDLFRVLDGELYVPGHDPRDDLALGNLYRLGASGWTKARTIPHALHAFDLAWHEGKLFAALGSDSVPGHATLQVSSDRGDSWAPAASDVLGRVYALFTLDGGLYGAPAFWPGNPREESRLLRWNGTGFERTETSLDSLYLGVRGNARMRMVRPTEFAGALVYVVARATFDWVPAALAVSDDARTARRVALPDPSAVPFDLLVRGGTLYVLTGTPLLDGRFVIRVYATAELRRWTEVFHFTAATFARSFEESGGDFFFGLGCDYGQDVPASGDLLRVRRRVYAR